MRRSAAPVLVFLLMISTAWAEAQPPPQASLGASSGEEYRIGIEDRLGVSVWGEPELSLSVWVRSDGKITLPLANDVQVVGLTPEDVRKQIANKLSKYVKDVHVTVIVEESNSFKVYFLGEGIETQGIQSFRKPTRLLQAISAAGGFAEFAKKDIKIFREQGGGQVRIDVDYKQILAGDTGSANLFLKPGDTLIVN